MSELEERIAERLRADAERAHPPADLGDRIRNAMTRRRQRRQRAGMVGTALAAAVVLAVPTLIVTRTGEPVPPPPTSTGTPNPTPTDTAALEDLHRLVDMSTAVTIPRNLPDDLVFVAASLTRDGTLYGGAVGEAPDDTYSQLWRVGSAGAPVMVSDEVNVVTLGAGDGVVVWSQNSGRATDQYVRQVFCMEVGEERVGQIGAHGVDPVPINVDRGIIVWTDANNDPMVRDPGDPPPSTVWVASGCRDPRPLPVQGRVADFRYPNLFVNAASETVRQIDVESGRTVTTYTIPRGMDPDSPSLFAAGSDVLAWADEESLFITDRVTARSRRVATDLPHAKGFNGYYEDLTLTAGDRLVAYRTFLDTKPYTAESLVYDPRTDRTIRLPGDALAAGDWLLWSEGQNYRLARVR